MAIREFKMTNPSITLSTGGKYCPDDLMIVLDDSSLSLLSAENIRVGKEILGITGTFTSDATALAADILPGKTAYVNGNKIVGTMPSISADSKYYTSDATPYGAIGPGYLSETKYINAGEFELYQENNIGTKSGTGSINLAVGATVGEIITGTRPSGTDTVDYMTFSLMWDGSMYIGNLWATTNATLNVTEGWNESTESSLNCKIDMHNFLQNNASSFINFTKFIKLYTGTTEATGSLSITENGRYQVTDYTEVDVQVQPIETCSLTWNFSDSNLPYQHISVTIYEDGEMNSLDTVIEDGDIIRNIVKGSSVVIITGSFSDMLISGLENKSSSSFNEVYSVYFFKINEDSIVTRI